MPKNDENYGSKYRPMPTFGSSGIRRIDADPETASRGQFVKPSQKLPSMTGGLAQGVKYQQVKRVPHKGPKTKENLPSEGIYEGESVSDFQHFYEEETGERMDGADKYITQEFLGGESNVF